MFWSWCANFNRLEFVDAVVANNLRMREVVQTRSRSSSELVDPIEKGLKDQGDVRLSGVHRSCVRHGAGWMM